MINVGIIGYGYWGPNVSRNFSSVAGTKLCAICDFAETARLRAKAVYPNIAIVSNPEEIINSKEIDVIAIVTPVFTHFELSKRALQKGKHIFVEKPFTSTVKQAEELIMLADKNRIKIMVDHTFIFTPAVKKIKSLMDDKILGDLYYYDSSRVNLGLFQHDINVIWDLATHDIAIMNYLIGKKPVALSAAGSEHFGRGLEDVAYLTVYFEDNFIAHFNVNWLSPVKIRLTLIGGTNKMLLWNDLEVDEKIKIYNKGVDIKTKEGAYNLLVEYRSGDIYVPKLEQKEALNAEIEYFVDCIENDKNPVNDGYAGLSVVNILEASNKSLKNSGKMVKL